jgi:hypothetical protein
MTIPQQIERTRAQLRSTKPRAARRTVLQSRLCVLMTKQLRQEIRAGRRTKR